MTATPQQRAAIETDAEKALLFAGPGSGKTWVIIQRIMMLVRGGVDPASIAVITYTNAAAAELLQRLQPESGAHRIVLGFVGTLHSFCLRHLQQHGGYFDWSVIDADEAEAEIARVAKEHNVNVSAKEMQRWRRQPSSNPSFSERLVLGHYRRNLEAQMVIDYDQILSLALGSLRSDICNADSCDGEKWAHLLADEYHDVNEIEDSVFAAIKADNRFYVFDQNQAIFSFKGGSLECIERLMKDPDWTALRLTGNFRSCPTICEAASRLIAHNDQKHVHKATESLTNTLGDISCAQFDDDAGEALAITAAIRSNRHIHGGGDWNDYAVLVRTRALADHYRDELVQQGIPVKQKLKVKEDPNWKVAKAALTAMHQRTESSVEKWMRAMQADDRKFGAEAKIRNAHTDQVSLVAIYLENPTIGTNMSGLASDLNRMGANGATLDRIGELYMMLTDKNIPALLLAMAEAPAETDDIGSGVTVSTIHSAKGREWENVILPAFENGVIPQGRADTDIQEERRIAYVGITRAKTNCWITSAGLREIKFRGGGSSLLTNLEPSMFIEEAGLA